jgi:hypothetical protein
MKELDYILSLNPCDNGRDYIDRFRLSNKSFKEAWNECPRGDWMLWLTSKINVDIHIISLAKGHCAKTVYHLMKDERSKDAVVAAINFSRNLITQDELNAAYTNAADAAADAAAYAADAAYAAANAANAAAANAAYAAAAAANAAAANAADADAAATYADAAYATYAAATYTAYINAKKKNQLQTANICRKYLTKEVFKILNIN